MPVSDKLLLEIASEGGAQTSGEINKVGGSVDKLTDAEKAAIKASEQHGKANNILKGTYTELNSMINVGEKALRVASQAIDATIGKTMEYAKQVRDLSTNLGIGAEETSKLIQAADDYGIEVGTVTAAMQMAVKRGYAPSIESLAKLADQYVATEDPIKRAALMSDVFGKNWTALTPMLKEGGDALRAGAKEAEALGLTLSEKDVKASRELEIALDNMGDKVQGAFLKIGKAGVDLANTFFDLLDTGNKLNNLFQSHEQIVRKSATTYRDYEIEIARSGQLTGNLTAVLDDNEQVAARVLIDTGQANGAYVLLNDTIYKVSGGVDVLTQSLYDAIKASEGETQETRFLKKAQDELAGSTDTLTISSAALSNGMNELTRQMIFNEASQNMDADAAIRLGLSMGVLDIKTVATMNRLTELRAKYDLNHDGAIDASEATAGYTREVLALGDAVNNLKDKTVHVNVVTSSTGLPYGTPVGGAQHGAHFIVPPNPKGGAGDYFPVIAAPGERVDITPAAQAKQAGTGRPINIVNHITAAAGTDVNALAEQVSQRIARQLRAASIGRMS